MPGLSVYPDGPLYDVTAPLFSIGIGRNEAETMTASAQFITQQNPHASGGAYKQAFGLAGAVAGAFDGPAGFYDLTVGYMDEGDGVSFMEVLVNDEVVGSFDWNAPFQDPIVTQWSLWEHTEWAVFLAPGDVVELRGVADGGEPLRTDYLDIHASTALAYGQTLRVEAEDMVPDYNGNIYVEANGAASGGKTIRSADASKLSGVSYQVAHSGHYDIDLGYFDETDGASQLSVYKNGELLTTFAWDDEDGSSIASTASARTYSLHDVELVEGDTLRLSGQADGGEPLRLDYMDLTAVEPDSGPAAPRLPDLWFVRDGEVKLSLNQGFGQFDWEDSHYTDTGIPTGIMSGAGELAAVDFDGDGDTDFLRVELADPFPLPPGDGEDHPGSLSITTTFYENNGAARFSVADVFSESFDLTWSGNGLWDVYSDYDVFDFADAGDMDGDGDIDFFGFSIAAQAPLVFENQGDNTFDLLEPQHPFDAEYSTLSYDWNSGFFADLNGDQFLDIVYNASYNLSASFVLINDGSGAFTSVADIYGGDDGTAYEAVGDLDGDGDNDIAVVGISDGAELFAFINDGTGSSAGGLSPAYPPSYEISIGRIAVADFDGDGVDEILNAGLQDIYDGIMPGLRLFEYDAASNLLVEASYDPNFFGHVVEVADFDGDGDIDFIGTDRAVFPSGQWNYAAPRLFLNDGTGSFDLSENNYVTPNWEGDFFWYGPPALDIGYFDDPYTVA